MFTPSSQPPASTPESAPAQAREEAHATFRRLLDAAGEVFASRGFRDATVREICGAAGANVAAVNYHFGDKAGLYRAVLRETHRAAQEPDPSLLDPNADPQARLYAFVHGMIRKVLDQGRPSWHGRLMAREMVEPTDALDIILEESIRPSWGVLVDIVSRLLGQPRDAAVTVRCAMSIVGQCVSQRHCRPVMERLGIAEPRDAAALASLAAHITQYSLGGIERARRLGTDDARPVPPGGHP
ncbi:MAG: CerR family C-terminal domain-containing protein [Phycisphaeraceae bacterium]|nr:CerR family C-terminal domain-containing protein [Phycisphaeraceae bacterium]